jgi:dUTP pyrophosphatase
MKVKIKKLHPDATIPNYATPGSSGFDLVAVEGVELAPGETKLVKTGLSIDVGLGYELQVRPRSGLSLKTNLRVSNSPGTVDSDYRGEVCVIMTNIGQYDYGGNTKKGIFEFIKKGDRIAQGVIQAVEQVEFEVVESLDETKRGEGGFGSTGK